MICLSWVSASRLLDTRFWDNSSTASSNSSVELTTLLNSPFLNPHWASYHVFASSAKVANAEVPSFLPTAGPTTNGPIPNESSLNRIDAFSWAIAKSDEAIMPIPPPTVLPWTRQIIILGQVLIALITLANPIKNSFPSSSFEIEVNSSNDAPAQNTPSPLLSMVPNRFSTE